MPYPLPAQVSQLVEAGVKFAWMPKPGQHASYPGYDEYVSVIPDMETLELPAEIFTHVGNIERGNYLLAVKPETIPEPPEEEEIVEAPVEAPVEEAEVPVEVPVEVVEPIVVDPVTPDPIDTDENIDTDDGWDVGGGD